ncbi:hypothetical protein C5167_039792, partial [Papaver somniferum]
MEVNELKEKEGENELKEKEGECYVWLDPGGDLRNHSLFFERMSSAVNLQGFGNPTNRTKGSVQAVQGDHLVSLATEGVEGNVTAGMDGSVTAGMDESVGTRSY